MIDFFAAAMLMAAAFFGGLYVFAVHMQLSDRSDHTTTLGTAARSNLGTLIPIPVFMVLRIIFADESVIKSPLLVAWYAFLGFGLVNLFAWGTLMAANTVYVQRRKLQKNRQAENANN